MRQRRCESGCRRLAGVAAAAFLVTAAPVLAGDGVKLLKQTAAPLPIVITSPGSYRLKGNIVLPDENTTGIQILSDDVTLDLNGFSIRGPALASGTGHGIDAGPFEVAIMNGTVRGVGGHGINAAAGRIERVRAVDNGETGILAANVVNCEALRNRTGFNVKNTVTGSTAWDNVFEGFVAFGVVSGNVSAFNGDQGIIGSNATIAFNNSVHSNGDGGITTVGLAVGNAAVSNASYGLLSPIAYGGNLVRFNNGSDTNPQTSFGTQIDTNMCGNDTSCP